MIYCFFSAVFISLFFVTGFLALLSFTEQARHYFPLSWTNYQWSIVLATVCLICLIAAIICGTQIPDCYVS